jgi:serine phosphatase RsbU (regulator of sigma subunit)
MDQEMYGLERLKKNAQIMGQSMNAEKLGLELKNHVQTYLDGCEFTDDFTLVILEVEP